MDGHGYEETRQTAQAIANQTGLDIGLQADHFGNFYFHVLPARSSRFGADLSCEVVSCENLSKCRTGHGPGKE